METIAPVSARFRGIFWVFVGLASLGAVLSVAGLVRGRFVATGLAFLAIGALVAAYVQLFIANYRLLISTDRFGYRDAFGRQHAWYAAQVGRIIEVTVTGNKYAPPRQVVYFLGLDGRKLFLLAPAAWPDGTVDRLGATAGKPVEVRATPMTPADFKREFPMAVSWAGAHAGLVVAGSLIVALGIAFTLTFLR